MAEYIDRAFYCENVCRCDSKRCDKSKCSLWKASAADVEEVKYGRWIPQIFHGEVTWCCSECKTLGSPHWKRCPVCEAKMDGERG